jgi:hypothetical protein
MPPKPFPFSERAQWEMIQDTVVMCRNKVIAMPLTVALEI